MQGQRTRKRELDNPIEILNPFDNLATEENEEADLIKEPITVTIPTFQCEECDKTFSKKTGLSQHERFRHPNIRNAKRIAEKENDIERKRLAKEKIREQAEETEGTLQPKRAVWSEAETKFLIQVEEELQGTKNINIANDEILKSKTAKQISNKRNTLFIRAKTTKEYTSPPPVPLAIPLVEMLKDAICVSGA